MKKYCLLFLIALVFGATHNANAFDIHVSLCNDQCVGYGFDCIHIEINTSKTNVTNAKATATENTITFDILNYPANLGASFTAGKSVTIGKDLKLPADLPKKLGYGSIKVLPGTYTVNYQGNKYGTITMKTVTTPYKASTGKSGATTK